MFPGGSDGRSTANWRGLVLAGWKATKLAEAHMFREGQLKGALEMGPDCPHSEYQSGLGVAG